MRGIVRDYKPTDFEAVRKIHETQELDYKFPDLSSALFIVKKVYEVEGVVRQCVAGYIQIEAYLFADNSEWGTPEEKLEGIKALDAAGMREAFLKGVDCCVLYLPPNMERWGERLIDDIHFTKDRDGWIHYSKATS